MFSSNYYLSATDMKFYSGQIGLCKSEKEKHLILTHSLCFSYDLTRDSYT